MLNGNAYGKTWEHQHGYGGQVQEVYQQLAKACNELLPIHCAHHQQLFQQPVQEHLRINYSLYSAHRS